MDAGPRQPLARWNPARDVWEQETLQDSLFSEPSDVYSETWPRSGSMRSGVAYAQPTSGPVTGAIESSSSPGEAQLLPTPTAYLGSCGGAQPPEKRRAGGHQVHLHDVLLHLFPTPTARDWRDGEEPPSAAVPTNSLLGRTIWHLPEGYDLPPGHAGLAEAWTPTAPPAGST